MLLAIVSGRKQVDVEVDSDGQQQEVPGLNLHELALSEEESAIVDEIIKKMKKDEATMEMVNRMMTEQADTMAEMTKGMTGPEKVSNLQMIIGEMQAVEVLFQDPAQALKLMSETGMISKEKLPLYQKDPKLLEEDTRKGLYFSFATMAVALGLL